jgi:hypothetical protein
VACSLTNFNLPTNFAPCLSLVPTNFARSLGKKREAKVLAGRLVWSSFTSLEQLLPSNPPTSALSSTPLVGTAFALSHHYFIIVDIERCQVSMKYYQRIAN